jgi:hypothetical protein
VTVIFGDTRRRCGGRRTDAIGRGAAASMPSALTIRPRSPEELPRRLIKLLSFPGDLVIDSLVGSGTSAVVARALGRRFWGCDRNPTAVARAQTRLEGTGNLWAS